MARKESRKVSRVCAQLPDEMQAVPVGTDDAGTEREEPPVAAEVEGAQQGSVSLVRAQN